MTLLGRTMMLSKIHRATVTDANLDYVGSITLDQELMRAAGLLENQQVDVLNVTNGSRLTTYAMPGPAGSGVVAVNGAAAHLAAVGDTVIVVAYGLVDEASAAACRPRVVFVDDRNRPAAAPAAPGAGAGR
ncbi:MAG: aspartate 1-decarboxylase [Bifidobacteriaceae bacterium]|jgi:aspartate 1-decarboxylase|nr:aspartate 1-decarboxylase [Bifidobacteriaceae bacterium]